MTKKKPRGRMVEVVITPKDLARSLRDIRKWLTAVEKAVLKLDRTCTVTIHVPLTDANEPPTSPPLGDGCPPPE